MKAIVIRKQGSAKGLQLQEIERPSPKANEVLIKVHAATVTRGDVMLRKMNRLLFLPMRFFGVKRKVTPGHEFAGTIETVGNDVKRFKVGDAVFGTTTGLSVGANAEYVCVPEISNTSVLEIKPANMRFVEAAAVPVGGMTALQILKKGNIKSGQKVLINGASGSVGSYAVQLAKFFGAEVTTVASTKNLEWIKGLGADRVIDYTKEDFKEQGRVYDVIFDTVGKIPQSQSKHALKENGIFLSTQTTTSEKRDYLIFLKELIEAGKLKAVIDRCYPLEEAADAHRYVEKGHKKGNVVIVVKNGLPDSVLP